LMLAPCFAYPQHKETFDLLMFTPPEGWQKETTPDRISYTSKSHATYCQLTLYKSTPGSGNSQQDFKDQWRDLVAKRFKPDGQPEQVQEQHASEWNINAGTASYAWEDVPGMVMLTTMSDANEVISLVFIFNDETYLTDIERFMESVEIIRPPQALTQPISQPVENRPDNAPGLLGKWGRSSGVSAEDAAKFSNAGYVKSIYNFKSDGTYSFKQRTFMMSHQEIIVVKESGSYSITGNKITISPARSVIESYKKQNGADELGTLISSTPRKFETTTYNFTFHYFAGIDEWNLVFQSDKETTRDGRFSTNTTYPNAWYFDRKFTEQEMDSARIDR
jgi:hypothetical protein